MIVNNKDKIAFIEKRATHFNIARISICAMLDDLSTTTDSQEAVCTACYGKGTYSVFEGPSVCSADFPGDKSYVVDKGGPKTYPCKRCNGTGKEESKEADGEWIDRGFEDFWINGGDGTNSKKIMKDLFKQAILSNLPKTNDKRIDEYEEVEVKEFCGDWFIVPKSKMDRFDYHMNEADECQQNWEDDNFIDEFGLYSTGGDISCGPKLFQLKSSPTNTDEEIEKIIEKYGILEVNKVLDKLSG